MRDRRGFDEVMIVNPHNLKSDTTRGVRLMRFLYAQPPGIGHYATPDPYGYGYYGRDPYLTEQDPYGMGNPYGYYGYYPQPPQMAPYAGPASYGQAPYEPGYGQIEPEPVGYYAEEYPYPMGEPQEPGYYGHVPETVGYYGEYVPPEQGYPAAGYYGQPDLG